MDQDHDQDPQGKANLAGLLGWGILLAVAAAMLLARFFGGGC